MLKGCVPMKLLALLLACAMAFGLGVSALAMETPYFISHTQSQTITRGDSCTFSVDVYIPAGWTAEYEWFISGQRIQGATESSLRLSPGDPGYPQGGKRYETLIAGIRCEIPLRHESGTFITLSSSCGLSVEPPMAWFWNIVRVLRNVVLFPLQWLTAPFRFLYYIFFAWE